MNGNRLPLLAALVAAGLVAGCGVTGVVDEEDVRTTEDRRKYGSGGIFGDEAFTFGGAKKPKGAADGGGIGVNSFLWRATLYTVSYMPLSSADPFGGVIITDWHSPTGAPDERFKLNVHIRSRALRADGVRVAVFRQVLDDRGSWRDTPVPDPKPGTTAGNMIEDAILTEARKLRNETMRQ